jgi:uncharacterized protein
MLLTNEFVVAADPDTVWSHLLDMEQVAQCVPGARVEEVVPPATYRGKIRLKIGPMTVEYRGEATLLEVNEEARQATIQMKAREARGQGSAVATVRNSLQAVPEGTRVRAETELEITGPQAQFGKGVLEDVGGRILEEFTARLERQIAASEEAAGGSTGGLEAGDGGAGGSGGSGGTRGVASTNGAVSPSTRRVEGSDEDALDLNRVLASSLRDRVKNVGWVVGAVALVAALVWGWRRGRR